MVVRLELELFRETFGLLLVLDADGGDLRSTNMLAIFTSGCSELDSVLGLLWSGPSLLPSCVGVSGRLLTDESEVLCPSRIFRVFCTLNSTRVFSVSWDCAASVLFSLVGAAGVLSGWLSSDVFRTLRGTGGDATLATGC